MGSSTKDLILYTKVFQVDIFVDYSKGPDDTEKQDVGGKLSLARSFMDEKCE